MPSTLLPTARAAQAALQEHADSAKAAFFPRFFKTGPGEYAEGDRFIGVTVPRIRSIAARCAGMPLSEIDTLLHSPYHECRLLAALLLVDAYRRASTPQEHAHIVHFYLDRLHCINNWDIVDSSAPGIIGLHVLEENNQNLLDTLAASDHLWTRRIAMVATLAGIRRGNIDPVFRIAHLLLGDPHDLLHKATGWMLREAGKKDPDALRRFLREHFAAMPRTALRYAIEKFSPDERSRYLRGDFP